MGRWAVKDGTEEFFVVESLCGGVVSLHIPSTYAVIVTREQAERVRLAIGAAIASTDPRQLA